MSGNRPVNDIYDAIARARDHSPFLRKQIEAHGDIVERLEAGDFAAAEGLARMAENGLEIGAALRRRRQRHALVAAIGDLAGEWDLSATVARLSEFADRTVETALAAAWDDRHPGEDPRGIAAIALGKLGSRELNYSSDIDIMLIFDPAAIPADDRDAAQKSALKIAQQLLRLLQDRTPEGYVFRVDLRLRHYAQSVEFGPGFDLKRGRGGIREIEFFAQIHQLIHGGRQRELRVPATLDALAALKEADLISEDDRALLAGSYRLLRTIEHRLQMVDDRQTHALPSQGEALDNVAQLHGLDHGEALLSLLEPPVGKVAALYDQLEEEPGARLPTDARLLEKKLAEAGIADIADARRRIEGWREGVHVTTRSIAAQEALENILPGIVEDAAAAPDPIGVLNRFDTLLSKLPSALNIFRLIEARPGLGRMLVNILSHGPALADALARRAEHFDTLIDATALEPPEPLAELEQLLRERSRSGSYQELLDRMRRLVNEERFALGVQLIEQISDPLEVAEGYARVAEAALHILADATIAGFETTHGKVPGSDLAILGLGRLGGGALTHASDLDLVYLFSGDHAAESDGEKPLGATQYYQRLAQRVTAALSVPTAAGALYEVDTRLRPSGNQGLLAVSVDSFEAYQRDSAWTWEHMALARARPVYGPPDVRARIGEIIADILDRPRDAEQTVRDAVRMRRDIAAHKPPAGALDVKLVPGGLVDLEFCVHLNQLVHGAGRSCDLSEAIADQAARGLLPADMVEAHRVLTRMLVTLRLVAPASVEVPAASRELVARVCKVDDWNKLLDMYEAARDTVSRQWEAMTRDASEEGA
ncbi:MAG: glutamine-synthetase adenylyltransferase [Sphingomonadales bacterium]|nr:glutamine-synthetase adenylyltransferase [Sphingomonadales bacterium]